MAEGTAVMAFYTSRSLDGVVDDAFASSEQAGFDIDADSEQVESGIENQYLEFDGYYDRWWFDFAFNLDADRPPSEPVLSIGCGQRIYPPNAADEADYRAKMDGIFELLCRLAVTLEADYAPLFNPMGRRAVPESRPIAEAVEELPRMGVYSRELLDELGGVTAMFESLPWSTASLEDGKTVVIESDTPWLDGGWRPPTEAAYLDDAAFDESDDPVSNERRGLADPFAALETGEMGTDLCVPREKIAPEFRNEDLELVRVRVDEQRDLRRTDTDSFVRNIVDDDPGDDAAFMMAMLADIPADAVEADLMVSALLRDAIPPAFVRLDDSSGETVVSRVMALDTGINKVELLVSLGRVAREAEFAAGDVQEMEQGLERLETLDDTVDLDQYLRNRLL
ncbi:hypothetical protein [Natrinema sp. 1APR25-10V2]|uniref:hypothetical protein n=1 Tax=Natrinema sp. 1APR25-10V2 TaxID=2951081 RepID=UPI0028755ABF|nr:hypothetical protein [Natrinema sp. 1APR25-10V2]MDS0474448.1 hypothetical protein [Natrinema sp. 1APR25-10V2]